MAYRKCEKEGCGGHRLYNTPDKSRALVCQNHRTTEMIYFGKNCEACVLDDSISHKKRAMYNLPGALRPQYCKNHKKAVLGVEMVQTCATCEKCDTQAHFNVPDAEYPKFCKSHIPEGVFMVYFGRKKKRTKNRPEKQRLAEERAEERPVLPFNDDSDKVPTMKDEMRRREQSKGPGLPSHQRDLPPSTTERRRARVRSVFVMSRTSEL